MQEEKTNGNPDDESVLASSPREKYGPPMDRSHVPKNLWRHSSMEICDGGAEARNESKVLVLYTGGTIGMMRSHQGGIPSRIRRGGDSTKSNVLAVSISLRISFSSMVPSHVAYELLLLSV